MLIIDADPASPSYQQTLCTVTVGPQPWNLVGSTVSGVMAYVSSWDPWTEGSGAVHSVGSGPVDVLSCEGFEPPRV